MTKIEILTQLEEILGVYQQLKAESRGTIRESFDKKAKAVEYVIKMLEQESNTSVSYR